MNKTLVLRKRSDTMALNRLLSEMPLPVKVTIGEYKKKRSLDQNSLYWAWLTEIRDHIRETIGHVYGTEDIHEIMRDRFLPKRVIQLQGESLALPVSTTSLTVSEFSDYLDKIDQYCADRLGLILPHPETAA